MKTEKDFKLMAKEFYNSSYPSIANFEGIQNESLQKSIIHVVEKTYSQAQQDMLAEASESFNDFIDNPNNPLHEYNPALSAWQTARLSMMKENEKNKETIRLQEKERQRSESFWKEKLEPLQDEVKKLREDLDRCTRYLLAELMTEYDDENQFWYEVREIRQRHKLDEIQKGEV